MAKGGMNLFGNLSLQKCQDCIGKLIETQLPLLYDYGLQLDFSPFLLLCESV